METISFSFKGGNFKVGSVGWLDGTKGNGFVIKLTVTVLSYL